MDKGFTCEHLNKLTDALGKDLWQSKENLKCFDCGCPGPNLWICLQPECHHVGCSEVKNDHSTQHQKAQPSHCVHMNVSSERIWCYVCEREVHIKAAMSAVNQAMLPDSTIDGTCSRLSSVGVQSPDRDSDDAEHMEDRARGLIGLLNMGNTCYMNAALQALSNTQPLTSYFLECGAAVAVLANDRKPAISRAYQKLIKDMWSRRTRGYVVPNGILYGIRNVHPMFRGYHQHDTQEFLRCFMDQLHEELKEPVRDSPSEDKLSTEADGDHQESRNIHVRRRAASSGASDAPLFARMRRKSPAASSYSESRTDGYLRVAQEANTRHRRSASFAGTPQFAYNVLTQDATNGPSEAIQKDPIGSESELSWSSDADERYETCSSGASDAPSKPDRSEPPKAAGGGGDGSGAPRFRSIISEVFDGKLLSSVQCLMCNRVSNRVETFQDLSLPIPSRDHLAVVRSQQPAINHNTLLHATQESWVWWLLSWLRSWFYGPVVSLQDCLAAFFSPDELKGDNMYSCSRCNKLRNGIKMSGVVRLPEVLCIHLKRFRHELMFSAKVAARVSFPVDDLNMAPYTHKDCTSKISRYELCAVICHAGTAGGGHYTCVARNARRWYCYDDASVAPLAPHQLQHAEAYVLFYKKVNPQMVELRRKAAELMNAASQEPNESKMFISKQWINKFNTWAEPGAIDNSDFVCPHGALRGDRAAHLPGLACRVPAPLWAMLQTHFGGGPALHSARECAACARAEHSRSVRRAAELLAFRNLHAADQEQSHAAVFAISMQWFRQWQAFVHGKTDQIPPPVDNSGIATKQEVDGQPTYLLKPGYDHAQLSEKLWRFFTAIYGGGPEVRLRPTAPTETKDKPETRRLSRKYSASDDEEHRSKSTEYRENMHSDTEQWLQVITTDVQERYRAGADSEDDVNGHQTRQEPNGNCDSDEDMEYDPLPPRTHKNTVRMENGVDSDHESNDDIKDKETELPNMESISLKSKPKTSKVRKSKKRTVK